MFEIQDSSPINRLQKKLITPGNSSFFSKLNDFKYEFTRSNKTPMLGRITPFFICKRGNNLRLSTKSRFAVTAMIDIALRENAGPVSLADIGGRHRISLSYLEQLFSKLRRSGLVESTRGPGGGYSLGRAGEAITVADIIGAVESPLITPEAQEEVPAQRAGAGESMTKDLWATLNAKMLAHMQAISLRNLASEQRAKGIKIEPRAARHGVFLVPQPKIARTTAPNSVFALGRALMPHN
jgi:Rrf2 family iron-sulfur cluster assembly transcriptional regulator